MIGTVGVIGFFRVFRDVRESHDMHIANPISTGPVDEWSSFPQVRGQLLNPVVDLPLGLHDLLDAVDRVHDGRVIPATEHLPDPG